jgi:hypothetical protein
MFFSNTLIYMETRKNYCLLFRKEAMVGGGFYWQHKKTARLKKQV